MPKILYADDEARYRRLVKVFLESAGFDVLAVEDGEQAIEAVDTNEVDLVLLDIMMPRMSGKEVCAELRRVSDIPIIMLTALGDTVHEVEGLNLGADDYMAKPFARDALIARINSLLRRTENRKARNYREEGFEFLDEKGVVSVDGSEVSLTPKEGRLLKYLLNNRECVLSREQILDSVWGRDYYGDPRTVDTHVKGLRARLGDSGQKIKTVRSRGYYYQSK